jgi:hypothetical protein
MQSKTGNLVRSGSGSLAAAENIGPQISASHLSVGDRLDTDPELRIEESRVVEPVRDGLLADCRAIHRAREAFGEGSLGAATDSDGALKGGDVRFLHERRYSTNRFVSVNNPVCVTLNKEPCIVLQMPATKRKTAPATARSNRRVALPGQDGKTLGQRVHEAMAYESGRRGYEYRQSDLVDDVRRLSGADGSATLQQSISAITRNTVSKSTLTPFIASACHVDGIWLASGLGSMIPKS